MAAPSARRRRGADGSLTHAGLPHDAAHKVDWRRSTDSVAPPDTTPPDTTAPRLVRGEIDGATMRLVFSEALDEGATGGSFWVTVQTEKAGSRPFHATGEVTIDGAMVTVGLGADNPRAEAGLGGNRVRYLRRADTVGALRDLAGNLVSTPHWLLVGRGWNSSESIDLVNVTGASPVVTVPVATRVEVTAVEVTSAPRADATYARGETIEVTVRFSEAVEVTGRPRLAIDMDPGSWGRKRAVYARGSGTAALVFAHEVVEPNLSTRGIAVLADTLALRGGTIRSVSSGADANLMHVGLPHNRAHKVDWRRSRDTTAPELLRGEVDGATVRLAFNETLGTAALLENGAFTVKKTPSGGTEETVGLTGSPAIDGAAVTLTLANAVLSTDTDVKVNYTRPASGTGNRLGDAAGNEVADFTDEPVTNETRVVVSDVEVTSDAGDDATYALRDVIRVTVTFGEAVAVTGAPRLKLALGSGAERWADYESGGGTAALAFAWTVAQGDASSVGVAVLANTLALNGGSIRSAASGKDAALAHAGLPHDTAHKVDGALPDTTPPRLSRTVVDGSTMRLAFNEAIDDAASLTNGAFTVKKTPSGGTEETVGLRGTPAVDGARVTLTLAQAVRGADTGVKVSYRKPAWDAGNRLRDAAGNEVASFSDRPVANSADTTPPELVRGEVDRGTMTLHFNEPLDEDATGGRFWVSLEALPGWWAIFRATGQVKISNNKVTVGLGRYQATAGLLRNSLNYFAYGANRLRDLAGNAVSGKQSIPLENLTKPPTVTEVAISSDAGDDDTYALGETIRVRLTFSEVMFAFGASRLKIDFSSEAGDEKWAVYASGSGTKRLEFAYTVAERDRSSQGVAVLANTLEVKVGTISSAYGKKPDMAHVGLGYDSAHKITTPDTTVPILSDAVVNGATLTLRFNELLGAAASLANGAFAVRKRPQGGTEETVSLSGSPAISGDRVTLTLTNAVLETDTDVKVSYTKPTSGTGNRLRDKAGNEVRGFSAEPVKNLTGDTTPPRLVRGEINGGTIILYFSETLDPDSVEGWFRTTVVLDTGVRSTFSAMGKVTISGNKVMVGLGGGFRARAGVSNNQFHYRRRPDSTANVLQDLAGNPVGTPSHDLEWAKTPIITLDNVTGVAPTVTSVEVSSDAGDDAIYGLGDTIRVRLTFSKTVAVTGTPRVRIDLGSSAGDEKWADYESGSGSTMLEFVYTVVEPNVSRQGIAVLANTLALNGGAIRSAAGAQANATLVHAGLGYDPAHQVDWRPALSVADAEVNEGAGASVTFEVSLSNAAAEKVTVDYATADGTATAGSDYTATSGTLTFAAGETAKTVSVPVLDDAIDEGEETFTFRLSNATGAPIADGEATGTIENSDLMPKAWTARFGRSVAAHVVDAVEMRLDGATESYVQLGGHRLGGRLDAQEAVQRLAPGRSLWAEPEGATVPGQAMTLDQLLLGSAFHLVSNPEEDRDGPRLSAWGRVATSGFDSREDTLRLDGTVTTATLGVDGTWERWVTGLLLAYSEGDGSFSQGDLPGGDVSSSLTSVHPYVSYTLSDRVRLWGLVGYGSGALQLRVADHRAMHTDLTMTMGALGVRGDLLEQAQQRTFQLALRSDVLWMVMDSAAADNLAATEAEASRLRLVLEGSRPVALSGGGSFTPSLELGLRHDGGDAETGTGVEVGGRLRYASAWGLSIEASVRALLAHEAEDYTEWGAGGALRFDPGRQGRGLTASITPTWGAAASGTSRLWDQQGATGLVPADALAPTAAGRLDAELGYGVATLRGRGLLTPYARVALTEGADQAWHLGTRLLLAESLNFSLEASRRAREGETAAHELALRANLGF